MRNFLALLSILILVSSCLSTPDSVSATNVPNEEKNEVAASLPVEPEKTEASVTEVESETEVVDPSKISDEQMVEYNNTLAEIGFDFPEWDGFDRSVYIMDTQVTPEEKGDNIWVDFRSKNRPPSDFTGIDRKLYSEGIREIFEFPSVEYIFSRFGQPRLMGFHTNPWVEGNFLSFFYGDVLIKYDPAETYGKPDEIRIGGTFNRIEVNNLFRTGQTFNEILKIFPEVSSAESGTMPQWDKEGVLYRDYWSEGNGYLLLEEGFALYFNEGRLDSMHIRRRANGEIPYVTVQMLD